MTVGPVTPRVPAPSSSPPAEVADRDTTLTVLAARKALTQAGERVAQSAEMAQRVQQSGTTFDAYA